MKLWAADRYLLKVSEKNVQTIATGDLRSVYFGDKRSAVKFIRDREQKAIASLRDEIKRKEERLRAFVKRSGE